MRLIDADEFVIEEPKLWDWSSVDGISSTAVLKQCIWDVQCAPTVKAIPIDKPFLKMRYGDYVVYNKKWLVNHLQTEWNILQGKEHQPAIPIDWIEKWGWKNGMSESMSLRVMIEDWEKENDKDSE